MDLELFKKIHVEDGAKYSELKRVFGVSFSTINVIRVKLGLPKRERSFARLEVDEELFLELYNSKNPYFTYEEIANQIGCCTSLVVTIRRRLNLPDRAPKPRLNINEANFKKMFLNSDSYDKICEELDICVDTIRRLKKKYNLPDRKKKSKYDEKSFVESYSMGLSIHKLAAMFGMERKTVSLKIKELGLPARARALEPPQATRNNKTKKIKDTSEPAIIEPVMNANVPKVKEVPVQPFKNMVITFSIPLKSLREIEKIRVQQDIRKAERQYNITYTENGYCALIGTEIDNPIADPFTR